MPGPGVVVAQGTTTEQTTGVPVAVGGTIGVGVGVGETTGVDVGVGETTGVGVGVSVSGTGVHGKAVGVTHVWSTTGSISPSPFRSLAEHIQPEKFGQFSTAGRKALNNDVSTRIAGTVPGPGWAWTAVGAAGEDIEMTARTAATKTTSFFMEIGSFL